MKQSVYYWVWLSSIPGVGSKVKKELIELFNDPQFIWHAAQSVLMDIPFMTPSLLNKLLDPKFRNQTDALMDKILREDIKPVTINDNAYPEQLKNIYDPPVVLFVKGKLSKEEKTIAVVGSRNATAYGLQMAEELAYQMSKCGVTVVSGLAKGIDTYAHQGALHEGKTYAVLGCGPDVVYPSENRELMKRIVSTGAVISEYVPGTPPMPYHFPARNRIISGLSLGVVVIEAGERSGSLITANLALEQGRDVFAVPGNVNSQSSKGTNRLIQDGAKMVTSVEDILEEFNIAIHASRKIKDKKDLFNGLFRGLSSEERVIAECLLKEPLHVDQLARMCGVEVHLIQTPIIMLELKGIVEQLPGKVYKLREQA